MKPFNLEAAMRGDPLITRDGRDVVWGGYNPNARSSQRVVCWVDDEMLGYYGNGTAFPECDVNCDLFMKPKKRTVWVNFCSNGVYNKYETKLEAEQDISKHWHYIATAVPVEVEDER